MKRQSGRCKRKWTRSKVSLSAKEDDACKERSCKRGCADDLDQDWHWEDGEMEVEIKEENYFEYNEYGNVEEEDPLGCYLSSKNDGVDENGADHHYRNCLLCYKDISKKESVLLAPILTDDMLEQNLNSVFILRKMLGILKDTLASYLESFGCPGKWVGYCKSCLGLVDEAIRIQRKIIEFEDNLKKCQEKMKHRIKSTYKKKNVKLIDILDINRITEESRKFVAKPEDQVSSDEEDDPLEPIQRLGTSDGDIGQLESPEFLEPSDDFELSVDGTLAANEEPQLKCKENFGNEFEKILQDGSYICPSCPHLPLRGQKMSLAKFCNHLIFHKLRPLQCSVCKIYWSGVVKELENSPFAKETHSNGRLCCCETTLVRIPEEGKFNPGNIWECGWCPKKFDSEEERNLHEDKKHHRFKSELVEMKYKCLSCGSAYRSYKEWILHRSLEHPEVAANSCLYCDYSAVIQTKEGIEIPNVVKMRKHIKSVHHSRKSRTRKDLFLVPETCDFCGVSFKCGTEKLKRHVKDRHKLTTGNFTYSCPCCWSRFGEKPKLRKHVKEEHEVNQVELFVSLPEEKEEEEEDDASYDHLGLDPSSSSDRDDNDDDEDDDDGTPPSSPAKIPKLCEETNQKKSGDNLKKILKGGRYCCILCPKTRKRPMPLAAFYSHLLFHAQRPYKCSTCNLYWSGATELEKNVFSKEVRASEHFCSEAGLVKVFVKTGKIWGCKWCPAKFKVERERDSHEDTKHSSLKSQLEMEYKCVSCKSVSGYRSFGEWLIHRALEHPGVAAISCIFCDYTAVIETRDGIGISDRREIRMHMKSMHPRYCKGNRQFTIPESCDFCGVPCAAFSDKLSRHIKDVHKLTTGKPTYSCPCCWSRFGQSSALTQHIKLEHSLTGRKCKGQKRFHIICDVCGGKVLAVGTGRCEMVNHKLVKHAIEPEWEEFRSKILRCEKGEECGGFATLYKDVLMTHMMKKHGAERKWKCEECGKGFTASKYLARHKQIHKNKGLKPYQCEICGNSYDIKNYLYVHMRLSHQNRPFASTNKKRVRKVGYGGGRGGGEGIGLSGGH